MGEPLPPKDPNKRLVVIPSKDPRLEGEAIYVDPSDPRYERYRPKGPVSPAESPSTPRGPSRRGR